MLPKYLQMEMKFMQICQEIKENGIHLDIQKCYDLINELKIKIEVLDKQLVKVMPFVEKKLPPMVNIYNKDGSYKATVKNWIAKGRGPYTIQGTTLYRSESFPPNPASSDQLRKYFLKLGWIPSEDPLAWNYKEITNKYGKKERVKDKDGNYIKTTPKLPKDDDELEDLKALSPDFVLAASRVALAHKLHALEGYIKNLRGGGRIPMVINSCGTNTMRVTHSIVCNVPRKSSFYGEQLRSVFSVPEGKVMVGCDAVGLEAFIMAHYLNDPGFTKFILENKKIHEYMYNICKDYVSDVKQQKNLNYAFLYGAGDEKLGSLCNQGLKNSNKKLGQEVRKLLMKEVPNLDKLQEDLKQQFKKYGGIKGIDGRLIKVRYEFAMINTLFQSGGAIACKYAMCIAHKQLSKFPHTKAIIFYHDEFEYETLLNLSLQVGQIMVQSFTKAGEYLQMNVPLIGEYKIGNNWSEVH